MKITGDHSPEKGKKWPYRCLKIKKTEKKWESCRKTEKSPYLCPTF